MATVSAPTSELEIRRLLRSSLSEIASVRSAHVHQSERGITVWVDIADDDDFVRNAVYHVEDAISEDYPHISLDFRVIPVPEGRTIEEFITADRVFARSA